MTQSIRSAYEATRSIGFNTHVQEGGTIYGSAAAIASALAYVGGHFVRDGATPAEFGNAYSVQQSLSKDYGIEQMLIVGGDVDHSWFEKLLAVADGIASTGHLLYAEGANEPTYKTTYPPGYGVEGIDAWKAQQHEISLHFSGVAPVIAYSAAAWREEPNTAWAMDGDYANVHAYPYQGMNNSANVESPVYWETKLTTNAIGFVISETGIPSSTTGPRWEGEPNAVTESVQAKAMTGLYMESLYVGAAHTALYELQDSLDPGFGVFRSDGSAKPAADALHNLSTLLEDPSQFAQSVNPTQWLPTVNGLNLAGGDRTMTIQQGGAIIQAAWGDTTGGWAVGGEAGKPDQTVAFDFGPWFGSVYVADPLSAAGWTYQGWGNGAVITTELDHAVLAKVVLPVHEIAEVNSLYNAAFGWLPDALGLRYHVENLVLHGRTYSEVADGFYNASNLHNMSASDLVAHLYWMSLGRQAAASELSWWTDQMAQGLSGHDVLAQIAGSPEAMSHFEAFEPFAGANTHIFIG